MIDLALCIYVSGFILSFFLLKTGNHTIGNVKLNRAGWDCVLDRMFLSMFSWIIVLLLVIDFIGNNTKPPKWL